VPDAVAVLLRALLRSHPQVVTRHLASGCDECRREPGEPRWGHLSVSLPAAEAAAADGVPAARAEELVTSAGGSR
jgi:hypothetical protein